MTTRHVFRLGPLAVAVGLSVVGCVNPPVRPVHPPRPVVQKPVPVTAVPADAATPRPVRPGGYYLDDGPAITPPANLENLPDPRPKSEPLHRFANNPYSALGQDFVPERTVKPLRQRGLASWYGRRFHGNKTATGEIYDMFQLSAAHPTLPLPSYARVTNTQNGRQVVVRVNDRGPFLHNRVMDLSYAAALKLGYVEQGVAMVEIETIVAQDVDRLAASGTPTPVGGPAGMLDMSADRKSLPLFAEASGVFVQVGAFLVASNAEAMRARLTLELSTIIQSMQIIPRGGMHRLWVGPFKSEQDARVIADQIAQRYQ